MKKLYFSTPTFVTVSGGPLFKNDEPVTDDDGVFGPLQGEYTTAASTVVTVVRVPKTTTISNRVTALSAAMTAAGFVSTKSRLTFAILGDSISEGMTARIPLPEARTGWFADCSGGTSTFLIGVYCAYGVTASTTVLIDWDGSKYMRANVEGAGYGAWVDVSGGGYFTLPTANGKYVFIKIRWRFVGTEVARVFSFTNQAAGTLTWCRQYTGDFFSGALAVAKMQHHTILNYAIGGDWAADILNRVGQVIALKPDCVLLMAGRNDAGNGVDPTNSILGILDALTAAGIFVIYADTITNNYQAGAQLTAWLQSVNYLRAVIPVRYAGLVDMVDMSAPYANPLSSSGASLEDTNKFSDGIHPSLVGTYGDSAQLGAAALKARFPNAQWFRRVSAADAFNASTNPRGNFIGARAAMGGTTGVKGGSVTTLTGNVPTNWTDSAQTGTFNTLAYTVPADASPIVRGKGAPGNYLRMVATNTSGATAGRYLSYTMESTPIPGSVVRMGLTIRLTNATGVTALGAFLSFGGITGLSPSLFRTGGAPSLASATLVDSDTLVLVSEPYVVPAGVTSAAFYIWIACAAGGGFTFDVADPWVALDEESLT